MTSVAPGWQYLPFQAYAVSIYNDNVRTTYTGGQTLMDGLAAWQDAIVSYGDSQGFTVNG